jgi:hypothetical protein
MKMNFKINDANQDSLKEMEQKKKDFYFIYNPDQCNYYLANGLIPIKFGYGKEGDAYLKFRNSEQLQEIFKRWSGR